jgi:hypothetical protein
MQRLIIQIAIISCASVISKAYSQKTLIIEIIEKENHIEVIAKNDWHNQSFIIDDSDKLFSTCIDVDYIVSRRDKGNLEIINRLNSKINYLSQKLINPIMLLIDSSVVFYDVTTIYFEAEKEDELRITGFSKDGSNSKK